MYPDHIPEEKAYIWLAGWLPMARNKIREFQSLLVFTFRTNI